MFEEFFGQSNNESSSSSQSESEDIDDNSSDNRRFAGSEFVDGFCDIAMNYYDSFDPLALQYNLLYAIYSNDRDAEITPFTIEEVNDSGEYIQDHQDYFDIDSNRTELGYNGFNFDASEISSENIIDTLQSIDKGLVLSHILFFQECDISPENSFGVVLNGKEYSYELEDDGIHVTESDVAENRDFVYSSIKPNRFIKPSFLDRDSLNSEYWFPSVESSIETSKGSLIYGNEGITEECGEEPGHPSVFKNGKPETDVRIYPHNFLIRDEEDRLEGSSSINLIDGVENVSNVYFDESGKSNTELYFSYNLDEDIKDTDQLIGRCYEVFVEALQKDSEEVVDLWMEVFAENGFQACSQYIEGAAINNKLLNIDEGLSEKIVNRFKEEYGEDIQPIPSYILDSMYDSMIKGKVLKHRDQNRLGWHLFCAQVDNSSGDSYDNMKVVDPNLYRLLVHNGEYTDIFADDNVNEFMHTFLDKRELEEDYEEQLFNCYDLARDIIEELEYTSISTPSSMKFYVSEFYDVVPVMAYSNGEDIFVDKPSQSVEGQIRFLESVILGIFSHNKAEERFFDEIDDIREESGKKILGKSIVSEQEEV